MLPLLMCLSFVLLTNWFPAETQTLTRQMPNGYLLAFKAVQIDTRVPTYRFYNHVSLFNITLDGGVTELWNISLTEGRLMFDLSTFAVDLENNLVYISVINQFLALDLHSGETVFQFPLEIPNLQYFSTYDYNAADETIYGVCTGNAKFNWCGIKIHKNAQKATVNFYFQLPYTDELGPVNYVYDVDLLHQTVWYYPGWIIDFALFVDCKSGKELFVSGPSNGTCIRHDPYLNRTFAIVEDIVEGTVRLTELQPRPNKEKVLMDLPSDLRLNFFGTCVYDQKTHTLIGLMGIMDPGKYWYHKMPTALLLIDVVNLHFEHVPLPTFMKKWDSDNSITGIKFIPY